MNDKLVLFDWGNIVESFTTGYSNYDAWNDLLYLCGYKGNEMVVHRLSQYNLTCIKNTYEFEKTYETIKKDFGLDKTYKDFTKLYKKTFDKIDYYKEVAEYEVSLREICSIGIFSNLTIFDKERLDRQVNLSKYDFAFLSFEIGLRKPDIEIFKIVQSKLPFEAQNILFIDDVKDNIESALSMGWNTLQATGLELGKIKQKCEEFLKYK